MTQSELKVFLDQKVHQYNDRSFIPNDPISIPHRYQKKKDIEIAGFIAAVFAWGQRVTIINKSIEFLSLMGSSPYEFMVNHREEDLARFLSFKHRTFNAIDALYFLHFFQWFYRSHESLEEAFLTGDTMKQRLDSFFELFFSLPDHPVRTYKHIPRPSRKSACKRINMFLRWMIRLDNKGVDFGIWNQISPAELICPCDLHVEHVGRALGLISRKQVDWETAEELTASLRKFDPKDPVKYDFALFSLGVEKDLDPLLIN